MKYTVLGQPIQPPLATAEGVGPGKPADNVGNLIRSLWLRRERILLGAVSGAVLGLSLWFVTPWEYAAEATLLVHPAGGTGPDNASEEPVTAETVRTEVGLFRARSNLLAGVEKLGLANIRMYAADSEPGILGPLSTRSETPSGAATDEVDKRLYVSSSGQDFLIRLRYRDIDPQRAEQVLGTLIDGYFASRLEQAGVIANSSLSVLDRQAEELRLRASAAAAAAAEFRQRYDLPNLRQGTTEEQEIGGLTTPLSEMRAERARLAAALDTGSQLSYGQLAEVRNSPKIQQLQTIEAELAAKEAGVSVAGRKDSTDLRETAAQLARVQGLIQDATEEIVTGLRDRRTALDVGISELEELVQQRRASVRETDANRTELQRLEQAADAAQEVYLSYSVRAAEVSARGHASFAQVITVSPPRASEQSEKRGAALYGVAGGFLGILGATMAVAAASLWSRRVWGRDDFMRNAHIVDCVSLPYVRALKRNPAGVMTYVAGAPTSVFSETLRGLRAQIQAVSDRATPTTVIVTSPDWGAGRSTVSLAMAAVGASDGLKVLLVEADMRHPRLGARLGPSRGGTEAVLLGAVRLDDAVARHARGLDYLAVDQPLLPTPELLNAGLARLLDAVNAEPGRWDMLVIDAPPVLAVSDALLMVASGPQCLLVAGAGNTDNDALATAIDRLAVHRSLKIFGVLNELFRDRRSRSTPYYSGS